MQLPRSENFWQAGLDRALRPVLGDVPRPRRGVRRARRSARRRHRSLPRVLEPRLHELRAARGRLADAAAREQHRHRHGPRADGGDPPGRRLGVRDRRLPAADRPRRGALRPLLRRRSRDHAGDADHRRPLAGDDLPDRRRRRALQRGARLRPAAGHAPGDPAGPGARARDAVARPLRRADDRADVRRLSRARASSETILRWVADEEEAFGRALDRGTELLAAPDRRGEGPGNLVDRRRGRLQAPRHLRLSLRPDQGAARRAGPVGGRRGLRGADGGAARAGADAAPSPRCATATRR